MVQPFGKLVVVRRKTTSSLSVWALCYEVVEQSACHSGTVSNDWWKEQGSNSLGTKGNNGAAAKLGVCFARCVPPQHLSPRILEADVERQYTDSVDRQSTPFNAAASLYLPRNKSLQ